MFENRIQWNKSCVFVVLLTILVIKCFCSHYSIELDYKFDVSDQTVVDLLTLPQSTIEDTSTKQPSLLNSFIESQKILFDILQPNCKRSDSVFIYLPNILDLDAELRKRAELFSAQSSEGVIFNGESELGHPPNLFFLETYDHNKLNPRQACAVESGSMISGRQTFVLFVKSRIDICTKEMKTLFELEKPPLFLYLDPPEFAKDTVIEKIWSENKINGHEWRGIQTSDLMRLLVVYKYGGWYSDLDTVTINNTNYINWNILANTGNDHLGNANFGFKANSEYIAKYLQACADRYTNTTAWNGLGPMLMTEVLLNMTTDQGIAPTYYPGSKIEVADPKRFFPIHPMEASIAFTSQDDSFWQEKLAKAEIIHFFNLITESVKVSPGNILYDYVGRRYCPNTYSIRGNLNLL